ncbi:MAG: hypothetical protein U0936_26570 [Planctomycetaceae bacterium]
MSAEIVFGLIPGAFGMGMLAIVYHVGVKQGNLDLWPFFIGGLIFGGIGGGMCAAPWRFRNMLKNTIYAVTTHRVLIINGIEWGSQWAVQTNSVEVQTFGIDQVRLFEIAGRRRDILLGGQWKRGRKGSQIWVNSGFFAAMILKRLSCNSTTHKELFVRELLHNPTRRTCLLADETHLRTSCGMSSMNSRSVLYRSFLSADSVRVP